MTLLEAKERIIRHVIGVGEVVVGEGGVFDSHENFACGLYKIFFSTATLYTVGFFFNLFPAIFGSRLAFALASLMVFPRLVRRFRESDSKVLTLMPVLRSLSDSVKLSTCSDTVLRTPAV